MIAEHSAAMNPSTMADHPKSLPAPDGLRCEAQPGFAVAETPRPRFSASLPWTFVHACPVAMRLQLASHPDALAQNAPDIHDTGWTPTRDGMVSLRHGGAPLTAWRTCHWRVRARDATRGDSAWSEPAAFATGKMDGEWPGGWIRASSTLSSPLVDDWVRAAAVGEEAARRLSGDFPVQVFRSTFTLDSPPAHALLALAARGTARAWINGTLVDDAVLDPVQTEYDKEIRYRIHPVSPLLKAGENLVSIELAGGWHWQPVVWGGDMHYGPASCSAFLVDEAGRTLAATGPEWQTRPAHVLRANLYAGECHDLRLTHGWKGGKAAVPAEWLPATPCPPPEAPLRAQDIPPIRATGTRAPEHIDTRGNGTVMVDFGANIAGAVRLRLPADADSPITIHYAEQLDENMEPDWGTVGTPHTGVRQADLVMPSGRAGGEWRADWTYKGFRYAKITGWSGPAEPSGFEAVVLRNDIARIGAFHCSDPFLNTLYTIACRSMESNLHGVFEDCPAREKCGWLGDIMASYRAWWLNYDIETASRKFLRDIQLATEPDGLPAAIAGGRRKCGKWVDFAAATAILPHAHYHRTGDATLLEEHFPYMRRYADAAFTIAMSRMARGRPVFRSGNWFDIGLGDWCDIPPNPQERHDGFPSESDVILMAVLRVLEALQRTAATGNVLGEDAAGSRYQDAALALASRINYLYLMDGSYGSQAADAYALSLGIPPQPEQTLAALTRRIAANGYHHDVGAFGHGVLTPVLARLDHAELALRTLTVQGYPGFADQIARGATSLWERQGMYETDTPSPPEASLNHHFHAGYVAFLFHAVAGLQPATGSVAWDHLDFHLPLVARFSGAKAETRTPRGLAASAWSRNRGQVNWNVQVPPGSRASIRFPRATPESLQANNTPPHDAPGIHAIQSSPGEMSARLDAGEYRFQWYSDSFTHA